MATEINSAGIKFPNGTTAETYNSTTKFGYTAVVSGV